MSKEKQIEEMAEIINKPCFEILNEAGVMGRDCPFPYECNECTARNIYNAGYRKQSEGEWVNKSEDREEFYEYTYQCSLCGYWMIICANDDVNFCPSCGARMKGGAE
jgi:hypothetical protein